MADADTEYHYRMYVVNPAGEKLVAVLPDWTVEYGEKYDADTAWRMIAAAFSPRDF